MSMFNQLEQYVIEAASELRRRLGEANIPGIRVEIVITGRTLSGDLNICYRLSEEYDSKQVTGNRIEPVVQEFLRRAGWDSRNKPICIGYDGTQKEEGF